MLHNINVSHNVKYFTRTILLNNIELRRSMTRHEDDLTLTIGLLCEVRHDVKHVDAIGESRLRLVDGVRRRRIGGHDPGRHGVHLVHEVCDPSHEGRGHLGHILNQRAHVISLVQQVVYLLNIAMVSYSPVKM